jgi:hypothetical protein
LTEASVEVMDVLGCEESDSGAVVPEGHRFGTQGGFEVGKEVTMEWEAVKKKVGLRGLARRSGSFGLCSQR